MTKRRFLPLMCVVASITMMTSCMKNTGFYQSADFARIVTIERYTNPYGGADSASFVADYTGEIFVPDNLNGTTLEHFKLADADRAIVTMHFESDGLYHASLELKDASPIRVVSVWNQPLPENASINPLTDLYRMQLDTWSYPLVWMADKYLNVAPVIRSLSLASYYLQPTAVYGDTLRFDMTAVYAENMMKNDIVDFVNFDLSTLADTTGAETTTKEAVDKMLNAIAANDSVRIMLVSSYRSTGYLGTDTVVKIPTCTGYTRALKRLVR